MATRLEQLRAKRGARAGGSVFERLRRFGVWKLLFMMFGLGVVLGIASVHLIPVALRLGLAPRLADRLPYLGFASGLLIGGSAAVSRWWWCWGTWFTNVCGPAANGAHSGSG